MAGALRLFWNVAGYSVEGARWTRQALDRVESLPPALGTAARTRLLAKAKALAGLAWAHLSQGENEQAYRVGAESVALYRQEAGMEQAAHGLALTTVGQAFYFLGRGAEAEAALQESLGLGRAAGDVFAQVFALSILLRVRAVYFSDLDGAQRYAEEAIQLAQGSGFRYTQAFLGFNLGLIAAHRKDVLQARRHFDEALVAFDAIGANFNSTLVKSELAHLERQQSNYGQALKLYRETIVTFRDFGQRGAVAHQLECCAFIAIAMTGENPAIDSARLELEQAVRLVGAAEAYREHGGTPMTPAEQDEYQTQVGLVRERLDPAVFARSWDAGRAMTVEMAVELATAG